MLEQEIPGARKGISKEETYNLCGVTAGKAEIKALEDHVAFVRV